MTSKIRKHCKNTTQRCNKTTRQCDNNTIKGTHLKCKLKSCKAKMYQSVYGSSTGGSIRSNRAAFY